MKTSNVLASVLFGSIAAAMPLQKRALVTKTETVIETVVVYTTVWDNQAPAATEAAAITSVYVKQPEQPSSAPAEPTSATPAYTPPVVKQPSSIYAPSPISTPTPTPAPESSSVNTPAPVPSSSAAPVSVPEPSSVFTPAPVPSSVFTPAPVPSSVYTPAPAPSSVYTPAPSSAAPVAPVPSSPPSTGSGSTYSGDLTVYDTMGAAGACGETLNDDMMIVALAANLMGPSTYNVMTGDATNPYCGKEVTINYGGKSVKATIKDKCPGCAGNDLDLSRAVWKAIGMTEDTRVKSSWSVAM
jgi:hypothetical protein